MQEKTHVLCVTPLLTGTSSKSPTRRYSFSTQIDNRHKEESNNRMKAHDTQTKIVAAKANNSNDVDLTTVELELADLTLHD